MSDHHEGPNTWQALLLAAWILGLAVMGIAHHQAHTAKQLSAVPAATPPGEALRVTGAAAPRDPR